MYKTYFLFIKDSIMFIFRRKTEETKLTTHCHLMPPTIQFLMLMRRSQLIWWPPPSNPKQNKPRRRQTDRQMGTKSMILFLCHNLITLNNLRIQPFRLVVSLQLSRDALCWNTKRESGTKKAATFEDFRYKSQWFRWTSRYGTSFCIITSATGTWIFGGIINGRLDRWLWKYCSPVI